MKLSQNAAMNKSMQKDKLPRWRLFKRSMRVIAPYSLEECHHKIEEMNQWKPRNWHGFIDGAKAKTTWVDQDRFEFSITFVASGDSRRGNARCIGYSKRWDNTSTLIVAKTQRMSWMLMIIGGVCITLPCSLFAEGPLFIKLPISLAMFVGFLFPVLNNFEGQKALTIMYDTFGRDDFDQPQADQ